MGSPNYISSHCIQPCSRMISPIVLGEFSVLTRQIYCRFLQRLEFLVEWYWRLLWYLLHLAERTALARRLPCRLRQTT
jgi:hypothetical protein